MSDYLDRSAVALPGAVPVVAWDPARGVFLIDAQPALPTGEHGGRAPNDFHRPFAPEALEASRRRQALSQGAVQDLVDWNTPASRGAWVRRLFGLWA